MVEETPLLQRVHSGHARRGGDQEKVRVPGQSKDSGEGGFGCILAGFTRNEEGRGATGARGREPRVGRTQRLWRSA